MQLNTSRHRLRSGVTQPVSLIVEGLRNKKSRRMEVWENWRNRGNIFVIASLPSATYHGGIMADEAISFDVTVQRNGHRC